MNASPCPPARVLLGALLALFAIATPQSRAAEPEYLITDHFAVSLEDGYFSALLAYREGRDYLPPDVPAPILQVRRIADGGAVRDYPPKAMTWTDPGKEFLLHYDDGITVRVKTETKPTHVTFEVIDVQPTNRVNLVLWGPIPTTIDKCIGESVGIVRGETFAIGIQALNPKTLGGYPNNADSCDYTSIRQVTDENQYENIFEKVESAHRMWGDAAWRKPFGSVLQAFTRDRSNPGTFSIMGFDDIPREPIADGGIIHSKIAIFGCPVTNALRTIGQIEIAENLPHPVINGEWVKESATAISTYLADTYNANPGTGGYVDKYLAWATNSHVRTFYFPTPGPFRGVGHYSRFNPGWFPEINGDHGVSNYTVTLDKVVDAGYMVGTHTMSAMISMNDLYVTQVDPRIKSYGTCTLANDVSPSDTTMTVTALSTNMQGATGRLLRLDTGPASGEIVFYGSKTDLGGGNYRLENVLRGRHGTTAHAHSAGTLAHVMWHDTTYDSTSGNGELNMEVARNLADYAHAYNVEILTMDGLEAAWSDGHGEYSRTRYANELYTRLRDAYGRTNVVLSGSNAGHYLWHIIGRYEWGDESLRLRSGDTRYRNMNQSFYERNLLPKFMGGYLLKQEYDVDDVEWFCSKAAGFDAGFSIDVVNPTAVTADSDYLDIVNAMKAWVAAREAGAFPHRLKRYLQDSRAEFHIEQTSTNSWRLFSRPDPNDHAIISTNHLDIPLDHPITDAELAIFAPMPLSSTSIRESGNTENGYPPENLIDGQLSSQWQGVPMPAYAIIDLGEQQRIDAVTAYPFFEPDSRKWWYTLDISTDATNWTRIANANGLEADADGDTWNFSARYVRYVKINVTKYTFHDADQGTAIIREIEWNPAPIGPTVRISSPTKLQTISTNAVLVAHATTQTGDIILDNSAFSWASDIDGPLGTGRILQTTSLTPGTHHFSAIVTDAGIAATNTVAATVAIPAHENSTPTVAIISPAGTPICSVRQGENVLFFATATDPEDGTLSGNALTWTSSLIGQIGTGAALETSALSPGRHVITFTAIDSDGAIARSMAFLDVSGPEISLSGNGRDIQNGDFSTMSADNTEFGSVSVGTATNRAFTIHNTGDDPLEIGGLSLSGNDFSIAAPPPTQIAPGTNATFTIQFAPTTAGSAQATLSLNCNDADENPFTFALAATAVTNQQPDIAVERFADISNNDATPSPSDGTDFQGTPAAGTNVEFTIRNTGLAPLDVASATVSGSAFSLAAAPATPIPPGESSSFTINCTAIGPATGNVAIASNDPDENPFAFAIAAEGALAVHLPLDETTGTTAHDASGNANNGLLGNGLDFSSASTTGKIGGALSFDGTQKVSVADVDAFSPAENDLTISLWVKPPSSTPDGTYTIVSKTDQQNWEWEIRINKTSSGFFPQFLTFTLDGYGSAGSLSANAYLTPDAWNHIAVTLDYGNTIKIYLNGVLRGSTASQTTMGNGVAPLRIATRNNTLFFSGSVDDFRLYAGALSQQAIQTIVNAATPTLHPPIPLITAPTNGQSALENTPLVIAGSASDPEDGALSGLSLRWNSSINGFLGTGTSITATNLSPGTHLISLAATDSDGLAATDSATIAVTAKPATDTDADGIPDAMDPDDDDDNIPDAWETAHNLDPLNPADAHANPDNDPHDNLSEYAADTDPNDAADYFRILSISNSTSRIDIRFSSSTNRFYALQASTGLPSRIWNDVPGSGPRRGNGGTDTFSSTNRQPAARFYRLRATP